MKLLKFTKIRSLLFSFLLVLVFSSTSQAARFYLEPASSEFNYGCQSAVNIMIDTEGEDSQAADALINFNPAEVRILDQNTSIAGTQLRQGTAYEFFPGNKVEGGKIYLTGASIMSPYNGLGLYGTIVFESINNASSTSFSFDYTSGSTVDSNISDVTGTLDLLNSANGGSYTFEDVGYCGSDTVVPWVENTAPSDGDTGVALDSLIRFDVVDNKSGVDIDTLKVVLDGQTYLVTDSELSYTEKDSGLRYSIVINPRNAFLEETEVLARVEVSDIALNSMVYNYSFNEPTPDNQGPRLTNPVPANGAKYDPSYDLISFHLTDNYSGVDDSTIEITVKSSGYTDVYMQGDSNITISGTELTDRFIVIDPIHPFAEEDPVTVTAYAEDRRGNEGGGVYSFNHPIADTQAPYLRYASISNGARQVPLGSNFSFSVLDSISGVDIDTLLVVIESLDGSYSESFDLDNFATLNGDKAQYDVVINPVNDFPEDEEMIITVVASDFKGNTLNTNIHFNRPAVCGDGLVEVSFGEQCDPPMDPFCTDTCQWGTCDEIVPGCGNLHVDAGEDCEPPNSLVCDSSCNYILPVEDDTTYSEMGAMIVLNDDEEDSFNIMIEDDDGDGLPNVMEEKYNTVQGSSDSDNDGYTDLEEIMDFGTDPNKFDAEITYDTRIVDPKDGLKTASQNIFVRGVSYPNKKVSVSATSLDGIVYELGETSATDDAKFVLLSTEKLDYGEYILRASSFDDDGEELDVSEGVKIYINEEYELAAPKIRSINDIMVKEGDRPTVYDEQPLVAGTTEPGVQVITVFESSIFSSTIIADSKTGFFTNFAPRPLEIGAHKVTVYALTSEGIMSSTKVLNFDIDEKPPIYKSWIFWWIIIIILILLIILIAYYFYKKHQRRKEIKEQKKLEAIMDEKNSQLEKNDESINWPME